MCFPDFQKTIPLIHPKEANKTSLQQGKKQLRLQVSTPILLPYLRGLQLILTETVHPSLP